MTDHIPITGEELEEMKRRLQSYRSEMDKDEPNLGPLITSMAEMLAQDLPRCIAEIERLNGVVAGLEQELFNAYQSMP
jgi:hypothetical protein